MLLELAGAYALVLLALFIYAEYFNKPALAVIAAVLIFPLGAWILGDGLQTQTGEVITYSGENLLVGETHALLSNDTSDSVYNETITMGQNQTSIKVYEDLPPTPYIGLTDLLGLMCFLLGLYATLHYALKSIANI